MQGQVKAFVYQTRSDTALRYGAREPGADRPGAVSITDSGGSQLVLSEHDMDELATAWTAFREAEGKAQRFDLPF